MILDNLISLWVSFCDISFLEIWFFPLIALCFIGFVPVLIRSIVGGRR